MALISYDYIDNLKCHSFSSLEDEDSFRDRGECLRMIRCTGFANWHSKRHHGSTLPSAGEIPFLEYLFSKFSGVSTIVLSRQGNQGSKRTRQDDNTLIPGDW